MGTAEVPDFLTVEEAARVLRIGRTTAYQQAHRWLDTGGEGLPVLKVGGSFRVPRAQFEQHYTIRVTAIPPPVERQGPKRAKVEGGTPAQDIPRPTPSAKRRKPRETPQGGLPFAG
ncbi:MAG TPA: helix-turn-helix domain-containing protein [Acidimicrobiales bacterium]|nr:helix-turn-helix domain-containing protein [Acidimicrobiales bacterium]